MNLVKVADPTRNQNHKIEYQISGYDKQGFFENLKKRYSDFYKLDEALNLTFCGLYLPILPSKKAMKNKDDNFIEERRHDLQVYLYNIIKHPYLRNSDEFTKFVKNTKDDESTGKLNNFQKLEILQDVADDHIPKRYLNKTQAQMLTLIGKTQNYANQTIP